MLNAYKEIEKRVHIDKLILGGDYTNEVCKEYKSDCFRKLRAELCGLDYFPVHGNHDDGSIWDRDYLKEKQALNHLTHEDLYRLFYNHLPYLTSNPKHLLIRFQIEISSQSEKHTTLTHQTIQYK